MQPLPALILAPTLQCRPDHAYILQDDFLCFVASEKHKGIVNERRVPNGFSIDP